MKILCDWKQDQAVDPTLQTGEALRRLRAGMERVEVRHRIIRYKVIVSAVVLLNGMRHDAKQVADILSSARYLTRENLTADQIFYATMLVILGDGSRASRQTSSEYGRAAQTLSKTGFTNAADAFARLQEQGIKKLTTATAVPKVKTKATQLNWSLLVSTDVGDRLAAWPLNRRLKSILALEADLKGRRRLRLLGLVDAPPSLSPSSVSAKPTAAPITRTVEPSPVLLPQNLTTTANQVLRPKTADAVQPPQRVAPKLVIPTRRQER